MTSGADVARELEEDEMTQEAFDDMMEAYLARPGPAAPLGLVPAGADLGRGPGPDFRK